MTDAREITVEEIDEYEGGLCCIGAPQGFVDGLCTLARRALSQESGLTADEMMGVGKYDPEPYPPSVSVERERETQRLDICASCGQPFRSCKCFNAPDTPQSVPTCTCSKHPLWDGYDGDCPIHGWFEPVAPDTPQSIPAAGDDELAVRAERDKLKEEKDYLRDMLIEVQEYGCKEIAKISAERDKLKEERDTIWALRGEIVTQRDDLVERVSVLETALEQIMDPNGTDWQSEIARAALRTSEDAK
jgi:hypothetical protein